MFQRILAPLDDTTRIDVSLRIAAALAEERDAQIVLVHTEPSAASTEHLTKDRAAMQRYVERLREQGVHAEYTLETGTRENGIATATRNWNADLILLVPEQREELELLWYSRSATHQLSELPAPLLIWPDALPYAEFLAEREAVVMAPLDGTVAAERSLPYAVKLAGRYHHPLLLAHAIPAGKDEVGPSYDSSAGLLASRLEAETYLERLQAELRRTTSVPILTTVLVGEPGAELAHAAKTCHAGVMVLCSHSHPNKHRYFMGCIATQILRQTNVPILVVPPRVEALATAETR